MADIFISYAERDVSIAQQVGDIIPGFGYSTWYYHRDFIPALLHLDTTTREIEASTIFIVVVSRAAFRSDFVFPEILHAVEKRKLLLPILVDLSHGDLEREMPRWAAGFGFSTAVEWENGNKCMVKILDACRRILGDRPRPEIDLDARGERGDTALLICIRVCDETQSDDVRKRTEIVQMLLAAGADPNLRGDDGESALALAKKKGLVGMAALLRDAGADEV